MSSVPAPVYSIDAAVLGFMPVANSIGDLSPLDGLFCLCMAPCTSFTTSGHWFFSLPSFLHSVLNIVITLLLFASATPCAHFAYGVHMVCFIPLASVSFSTILLQKCVPPSEWMRSGSGYTGKYCSKSTFITVSADAFFVGCRTVVRLKSSVIARMYLHPFAASGSCMKSMCMYSNGLVAYTMYHIGLGMVLPVFVFMHDRHFLHNALMNSSSIFLPMPCMV